MKVRVVKKFRDKNTKNLHNLNDEIKISKERYEEINSTFPGIIFVEEIVDTEEKPKKKKKSTKKAGE